MIEKCHKHPEREAIAICHYCHRYLCSDCSTWNDTWKYYRCKDESECLECRAINPTIEELATSNMYDIEALIEVLARKEIVTKKEILEEIKKMKGKKKG